MPSEPTGPVARRLLVHGRVQGVNFRAATARTANQAGARGWVRNLPDGTVEIHVEGDRAAVERVVAFAHEGPRAAEVDRVETGDADAEGLVRFDVR